MEGFRKQALFRSMVELTHNLDPDDVAPYLIAEGILLERDIEKLEGRHTREEKVRTFVFTLQTRGKKAFDAFIAALQKFEYYAELVTKLKDEEERMQQDNRPEVTTPAPVPRKVASTSESHSPHDSAEVSSSGQKHLFPKSPKPLSKVPPPTKPRMTIPPPGMRKPTPTVSPKNTTTSTVDDNRSDINSDSCRNVLDELKKQYFDPIEMGSCRFVEYKQAKENALREYEAKARGPKKAAIGEKGRAEMDRDIALREIPVADCAFRDALEMHRGLSIDIINEGQFDEEVIMEKFRTVYDKVQEEFHRRCQGINAAKLQQNTLMLSDKLGEKKRHFVEVNNMLAHARCEEYGAVCVSNVLKHFNALCERVIGMDLDGDIDIKAKFDGIQEVHLKTYDDTAMGPTKLEVRGKTMAEIERHSMRLKNVISDDALTKAIGMYHKKAADIRKEGPLDEAALMMKHKQAAKEARKWFLKRLEGFNEIAISRSKEILITLTESPEAQLVASNYRGSITLCNELSAKISEETNKAAEQLIPLINLENLGTEGENYSRLEVLKMTSMKKYDDRARGPAKLAFRMMCEENIDRCLVGARKYLSMSSLQLKD